MRSHDFDSERNGPGLFFILVTLVVVAVLGARYLGFYPPGGLKGLLPPRVARQTAARVGPSVAIYHTHTSENYAPGESHARGEAGQIVEVGRAFKEALAERGITAVHSETVHDYPVFKDAFDHSYETVSEQLAQNASIKMVFDLHRDGLPPEITNATTATVNGEKVARIAFVVGDQDNPHLAQNLAFAESLDAKLNELYPGVSRGVKVQHGSFNLRVSPQAVTVFIGSYPQNTKEEAERAAKLLADAVAALALPAQPVKEQ
ncbi:MAG: stage II sporulation protein P [Betaproteobacteria bacterium]